MLGIKGLLVHLEQVVDPFLNIRGAAGLGSIGTQHCSAILAFEGLESLADAGGLVRFRIGSCQGMLKSLGVYSTPVAARRSSSFSFCSCCICSSSAGLPVLVSERPIMSLMTVATASATC